MKDSYDHHAAIYFLLLDKLKEQKMSGGDGKRRRPSTIAEQPSKVLPVVEDFHSLRLRTGSESERETAGGGVAGVAAVAGGGGGGGGGLAGGLAGGLSGGAGCELGRTEHNCLTCGSPILENTTSTTSCVKCARLRTRRMNFAHPPPQLSRDSGVSGGSGSSQDTGDVSPAPSSSSTTTFTSTASSSSSRPGKRDSVQFSTLVRKLSEVEGINPSHILRCMKTSIDEGVELDYDTGSTNSRLSSGGVSGGEHDSVPSLSSGTSNSDYQSIENCSYSGETTWSQSLPSCAEETDHHHHHHHHHHHSHSHSHSPVSHSSRLAAVRFNPLVGGQTPPPCSLQEERTVTRSPVNFREGRRSSDGLVAQGLVAFQQRLYDTEAAAGQVQLQQVCLVRGAGLGSGLTD